MDLFLKGQTAIVTGASQGIGKAIVRQLALEGVKVLATARNQNRLESLKQEIAEAGGIVPLTFVQDFAAPDAAQNIAAAAWSALGHVDILINNAGQSQPVEVVAPEEPWLETMHLDFNGPRLLTQALLPHLMARKRGAILNLASTYELRSVNVSAVAKSALIAWSKQLAGQLGPYGIRVNCLQPGLIDTNNIRPYFSDEGRREFAASEIPLGDFGQPADMANMAVFLVSPRAAYVTGTVAVVDGGMRRYPY